MQCVPIQLEDFSALAKMVTEEMDCSALMLTNVLQVRAIALHHVQINQELSSVPVILDFLEMDLLVQTSMNVPSTQTTVQTHHQDHVQIPLEAIYVPADLDTREMERHVLTLMSV